MGDKRLLYQLILSQLTDDGFASVAAAVSEATMTPNPNNFERDRLDSLVKLALNTEKEKGLFTTAGGKEESLGTGPIGSRITMGLDFEREQQTGPRIPPYPEYNTRFVTSHQQPCRTAKFSPDGKMVATGSLDTSIKLLDVSKMLAFSRVREADDNTQAKPVIRTFYDHVDRINDVDFHPTLPVLVSCSTDTTIKFYDYSTTVKRSFKFLQDTHNIRSVQVHPSGEFILAGTQHPMLRIYDINKERAYVTGDPKDNHMGPINQARYSSDGKMYASASKDGSIKLWDGVTNKCIDTIAKAHENLEVSSVQFSRNRRYLLTGGRDGSARLWDVATRKQLSKILFGQYGQPLHNRLQVCFNWNEDFILAADEMSNCAVAWNTRTSEHVQRLQGHTQLVRWICASPVDPYCITCSDDNRARFWVEEANAL